jgi:hypothetical protein
VGRKLISWGALLMGERDRGCLEHEQRMVRH